MRFRECMSKNAGVAGYVKAFWHVLSESQTGQCINYLLFAVLVQRIYRMKVYRLQFWAIFHVYRCPKPLQFTYLWTVAMDLPDLVRSIENDVEKYLTYLYNKGWYSEQISN